MAGRIELITGPMFAGKTTELCRRLDWREKEGYNVPYIRVPSILTPTIVFEGGNIMAKSHDGEKRIVVPICDLEGEFIDLKEIYGTSKVAVGIDEVQFFPPEAVPIIKRAAREWGWTVICAGLDYDFKRYEFSTTWELREIADVRIDMFARCAVCGGRADVTQRLHLDGTPARWDEPQIVLDDGSVRYEPRCWRCHVVAPAGGGD
ncbi:MAG: hypothetical protein HPY52_10670 [Firmicutes bacterium]|nr:hypothetical protein [Bacillota bacterium]